jgi:hypothetical protein
VPDSLVVRINDTGECGLRIHDGGCSFIAVCRIARGVDRPVGRVSSKERGPPAVKTAGFQLWVHGRQFPKNERAELQHDLQGRGFTALSQNFLKMQVATVGVPLPVLISWET